MVQLYSYLMYDARQKPPLSLLEFPVLLLFAVNKSTEWQGLFSLCLFSESNITNSLNSGIKSHPVCDSNDMSALTEREKSLTTKTKDIFFQKEILFSS